MTVIFAINIYIYMFSISLIEIYLIKYNVEIYNRKLNYKYILMLTYFIEINKE